MAENLGIYNLYTRDIGNGYITVDVETKGQGTLSIYINNIIRETTTIGVNDVGYGSQFYTGAGTHTVKAVGTGNSQTTSVVVLPLPIVTIKLPIEPHCFGELGMNLSNVRNLLSKPALPSSINVPVYITGAVGDLGSTRMNILVDGKKVRDAYAGDNIDILNILRGRADITKITQITLVPESKCIKEKTFDIPPLIPSGLPTCTPPQVYNPVTGKCEYPIQECTPPKVYNPVTGRCETPPIYKPPPPPPSEFKLVRILPEDRPSFPNANEGETIKITATIICKKESIVTKPNDTAYLIIDGANIENKKIEAGVVTFDWQATATPFNIHTICIKVPSTELCKGSGQDCKKITVSPIILSPTEQLVKERESGREQRRLLQESRQKLREEIITGEIQPVPYTPTIPVISPVTPPTPTVPDTGSIEIIGLPILITPAIPVYLYIDNDIKGRIYELPKTFDNIITGIHTVYVESGNFKSSPKTVIVAKNQTSSIII